MRFAQTLAGGTTLLMLAFGFHASGQMPDRSARPIVDGIQFLFAGIESNVMKTAELATPDLLAFRPAPEVRSFGEILGHIADSQKALCAGALGKGIELEDTVEKGVSSKDGLTAALRSSFELCKQAVGPMSDADAAKLVPFGPRQAAAATILNFNVSHTNEHYGNLVTYMRLKGIVPPSSAGRDLP